MITDKKRRFNHAEHLVHGTKKNRAVHDFDSRFPKMPSYLRRSAITHALGAVSSYRTRLAQWEEGGKEGKAPVLGERTHAMPVFYRKNMYREEDGDAASLKQAVQRQGLGMGEGRPPSHGHGIPEEELDRREGLRPDTGEEAREVLPAVLVPGGEGVPRKGSA